MSQGEKNIGTLIIPESYLHELNQVAAVTSTSIVFLKRKFVSSSGWELVKFPMSDCFEIHYEEELPLVRIIAGTFISALIVAILVLLFYYWSDLGPGTQVPVITLAVAGFYGVRMAMGGRQHRLKFKMHDGSTLTWKSRAGERQLMGDQVNAIVEFARSKGLLNS